MTTATVKESESNSTAIVKDISVRNGYSPYIGDNGNWWQWSAEYQCYVDTDVSASGTSGSTGTTNYNNLKNLPTIGNETIKGDMSSTIKNMITAQEPDLSNYVTQTYLNSQLSEIDQLNVPEWAMSKTKPTYDIVEITNASKVAKSNSYTDLDNQPTSLKNPNALQITGLTNAVSYDGSNETKVELDTNLIDNDSPTNIPTSKAVVELVNAEIQSIPSAVSYSLEKVNSKIILQGSNGTSSSVYDTDTVYDDTEIKSSLEKKADLKHTHKSDDIESLDVSKLVGIISSEHIPGGTESIKEYQTKDEFPTVGSDGIIYVDVSTGTTYKWGGSMYVILRSSLALGETSESAYRGDLGKVAYDHARLTSGNPHNVTKSDLGLANVENKNSEAIRNELTKENVVNALNFTPIQKSDVKLYVSTGSNSDGAMSQYATTQELNKKSDISHTHSDLTTNISSLQTSLETANTNIATNAANIETQAKSISEVSTVANSANSKIDNLEIGGRNLLLGSKDFDSNYWYCSQQRKEEIYDDDGFNYKYVFDTWQYHIRYLYDLAANQTYTLSLSAKAESSVQLEYKEDTNNYALGYIQVNSTDWQRYSVTFTPKYTQEDARCSLLTRQATTKIYIKAVKLEKGNKATDWTPAPEDTQSDIDNVKQIADTANSNASSAKQTAESALSATQTLEDKIEELTTKITALEDWKSKVLTGTQKVLIETN
jgi:hypothetical protein